MEFRLKNVIKRVENLLEERQKLLSDNQNLITEIEALKVALREKTINTKQHGDDKQINIEVDSSETLPQASVEDSKSKKLDASELKQQIESALEDIDQCINIISAK